MRKTLLFILLLASLAIAHAQKRVGTTTLYPRVGMTFSKFSNDKLLNPNDDRPLPSKFTTGFTAGLEAQHQFTDLFAASIGLLYSEQGTDFKHDERVDMKTTIDANYLVVPVLAVFTSPIGLSLKMGLQPEVRVSNKYDKVLNRMTLSLPLGLSYEYRHIALDIRYAFGLTHIYKDQLNSDSSHNATLSLTLGYAIGL